MSITPKNIAKVVVRKAVEKENYYTFIHGIMEEFQDIPEVINAIEEEIVKQGLK